MAKSEDKGVWEKVIRQIANEIQSKITRFFRANISHPRLGGESII